MVVSMDRWVGKVAIVTGASNGIGAAIAESLVEAGLQVVGLARRVEKMMTMAEKLHGKSGKLHPLKVDMGVEDEVLKAFEWVTANLGPIHILVNNAALLPNSSLTDGDTNDWRKTLDVNVIGVCVATREAVRDMRKNGVEGHIVHVNSVTGHKVPYLPNMNIYPASKHAITALTETIRIELNLAGDKIKISSISPGGVDTDIHGESHPDFHKMFSVIPKLRSEDIADAVIYILSTPPHVQVHDMIIKPIGEQF